MNTTRESVAPAMRAAAEDLYGPDAERVFTADTRDLMGLFIVLRKLLAECGIGDFTFQDLYKPTRERLVKIFSYVINFIRFRESQTSVIDEHFNKSERTKLRIEQLFRDNQAREAQLGDLERGRKQAEQAVRDKERRNNELKQRLLELKKGQERVAEKLAQVKEEQLRLKDLLEERTAVALAVRQDAAKLRPYTTQSPQALEQSLRDLNGALAADRAHTDALDRRARALQASADAFAAASADVSGCARLAQDAAAELAKEEDELAKAARHRDALSDRSASVRDVERQERLLQKQLANVGARTSKLRTAADDRADAARARVDELKAVHRRLAEERAERNRDTERRRVRVEQTEKKMADLRENIEAEVRAARDEYLKMEAHIKLYTTEMEQSI